MISEKIQRSKKDGELEFLKIDEFSTPCEVFFTSQKDTNFEKKQSIVFDSSIDFGIDEEDLYRALIYIMNQEYNASYGSKYLKRAIEELQKSFYSFICYRNIYKN